MRVKSVVVVVMLRLYPVALLVDTVTVSGVLVVEAKVPLAVGVRSRLIVALDTATVRLRSELSEKMEEVLSMRVGSSA